MFIEFEFESFRDLRFVYLFYLFFWGRDVVRVGFIKFLIYLFCLFCDLFVLRVYGCLLVCEGGKMV